MIKTLNFVQKTVLILGAAMALMLPAFLPAAAGAQIPEESKNAACEGLGTGNCNRDTSGGVVSGLVGRVINILSWIVGIVSVVMVVIGGFKFIVSNGDANGVKSARNTVIYALIGLAVAMLAQVLVRFVINEARVPATNQTQQEQQQEQEGGS